MEHRNICPNIITYKTLINGLCKVGEVRKARELFDEILGKGVMVNSSTYATLIDGYSKSGNLFEAFSLLDELPMKGIRPDKYVYEALVSGCSKQGDTERIMLICDLMVKSCCESTPTFNTLKDSFSKIIHHHCKSGMIKEAEHLLMVMKTKKMTPTIKAYTSLLHSYIKSGETSNIFTIFEDLMQLGTSKNEVSDILVDILSEEYNVDRSFELWDELVAKEHCCRSVFDRLLEFFCKKGKFGEALASIDEEKKRIGFGFDTCKALVVGLKNRGYDDEVAKVFENVVKV